MHPLHVAGYSSSRTTLVQFVPGAVGLPVRGSTSRRARDGRPATTNDSSEAGTPIQASSVRTCACALLGVRSPALRVHTQGSCDADVSVTSLGGISRAATLKLDLNIRNCHI